MPSNPGSARAIRRAKDREAARSARRRTQGKAAPSPEIDVDALAAAAAGGSRDDAAVQQAAAEAAARTPGAAGAAATPPLTMDEIPPEAQKALQGLLKGAEAPPPGAAGSPPDLKESSKRAKKFIILERELAELLTFPAGPALMAGDTFCAEHFAVQGPMLARQLTIYSESHPATFDTLVWLARQGSLLVIATAVVGYLLPPAIHHGLPAPNGMRKHYGMEPRPEPAPEPDLQAVA